MHNPDLVFWYGLYRTKSHKGTLSQLMFSGEDLAIKIKAGAR